MAKEDGYQLNDQFVRARGFLPQLEGFTSWIFTLIEWATIAGFVQYVGQRFNNVSLQVLGFVLLGLLTTYATVVAHAKVPPVRFFPETGWVHFIARYVLSTSTTFVMMSALIWTIATIAEVAAQSQ